MAWPIPADIKAIFEKPGRDWPHGERNRVKLWLHEVPQLPYLLSFAKVNLGSGSTPEDAVDAWGDFFAKRLDSVINRYEPEQTGAAGFWPFLKLCFKRFCWERGERLRRERAMQAPQMLDEDGNVVEIEILDIDPSRQPEDALRLRDYRECIEESMSRLPAEQRQVVIPIDLEGRTYEEAAQVLMVPVTTVRMRLRYGRKRMKELLRHCLEEKGYSL